MDTSELCGALLLQYPVSSRWNDDPYVVMFQSVLVQNTSWKCVITTCASMTVELIPSSIDALDVSELESQIRSCGFCKRKALTIKSLTSWYIGHSCNSDLIREMEYLALLDELTSLPGVGRETSDVILCYAFGFPVVVIDAYLRAIAGRVCGFTGDDNALRGKLEYVRSQGVDACGRFHRAVLEHGISVCGRTPKCDGCCFAERCEYNRKK